MIADLPGPRYRQQCAHCRQWFGAPSNSGLDLLVEAHRKQRHPDAAPPTRYPEAE